MVHDKVQMHHLLTYFANKELTEMYAFVALRTLAMSMVSIFVPIYILQLPEFSMYHVLVYISAFAFVKLCVYFFVPYLFRWIGFRNILVTSLGAFFTALFLLRDMEKLAINPITIGLILGSASALYFMPFHIHFKHASDRGKRGREFGFLHTVSMSMSVLAPLLGALSITVFGFGSTYALAAVIVVLAAAPLYMTKINEHEVHYDARKVFVFDRTAFIHFCEGTGAATTLFFWPLFVYVTLNDIGIVGIAASLGTLLMAIVTVYVGKVADDGFRHTKTMLQLGSVGHSLSLVLRVFALSVGSIFSVQMLGALTRSYITIPMFRLIFDHQKLSITEAMGKREFFLHIGMLFTVIVSFMSGMSIIVPIVFSGFATLAFTLVREDLYAAA